MGKLLLWMHLILQMQTFTFEMEKCVRNSKCENGVPGKMANLMLLLNNLTGNCKKRSIIATVIRRERFLSSAAQKLLDE